MSTEGAVRRRRARDETRELLLEAAVRLVVERIDGEGKEPFNPLADVLLTDVLAEANRALKAADPEARKMTTGAAYNIWPAQTGFQMDLLARVLDAAATPGMDRVRAATLDGLARQFAWASVLAGTIDVDFEESFQEPSMFLMIGITAMATPADVIAGEAAANQRYVAETGELLTAIIRYAGRRLRRGRTLEDLVWAIEALETGYLLRRRTHPDIPLRQDAGGHSAVAAAAVGVVEAFTEPDDDSPGADTANESRSQPHHTRTTPEEQA
jgi:hypothetical protein